MFEKSNSIIHNTKNYAKFNLLKNNRRVMQRQVENIKKSIEAFGYKEYRPVIVDEDFNIIDGQHRFKACQELKLPIYYSVETDHDAWDIIIALNANQKNWALNDYIHYHASNGKPFYIYIEQYMKKYGFTPTTATAILVTKQHNHTKMIREWYEFEIPEFAEYIANKIHEMKEVVEYALEKPFVLAFRRLLQLTSEKEANKIANNIETIRKQGNVIDYLTIFENKINYRRRWENRVSLLK